MRARDRKVSVAACPSLHLFPIARLISEIPAGADGTGQEEGLRPPTSVYLTGSIMVRWGTDTHTQKNGVGVLIPRP